VTDLAGRAVDPLGRDGVVALVFVATECPISNRYAPTLQGLAERFEGVPLYAVYPDPEDDVAAIEEHRRAYDLRFAALRDPEHQLVEKVGARVTPEAAVYRDRARVYRGRIDDRAVELGTFRSQAGREDLAAAIEAAAGGGTVEPATTEAVGCYISDLR
jgi:thiol-disulfide isomerase/thioredoxin